MSLLKSYIEGNLPLLLGKSPYFDLLPTAIKEKVLFIEKLIDEAIILLGTKETFPEKPVKSSVEVKTQSEHREVNELIEVLNEKFEALLTNESNFEAHETKLRERANFMTEILSIIYEVKPELSQRIFNRIKERHVKPIKYPEEELQESLLELENIKLMADPQYEPGVEIDDLRNDLMQLMRYWLLWPLKQVVLYSGKLDESSEKFYSVIKTIDANEATLDLSLAKIAYHLGMKIDYIRYYGRREQNRGKTGGEAKRAQNAPPIAKAFWDLLPKLTKELYPEGVFLNKVATLIRNIQEKEKRIEAPNDIKTITNHLKANEEIMKLFKEVTVGKKTYHIMKV